MPDLCARTHDITYIKILQLKMSHKPFAYKHLVLYKDSQIPRAGFLSSQILYLLEILKFFILFFLFQRAAVRAKSRHGFTTEPMFQLDLTRFTSEVLFVVCINILFINPLVLPENVLFFSYHKPNCLPSSE